MFAGRLQVGVDLSSSPGLPIPSLLVHLGTAQTKYNARADVGLIYCTQS